MLQRFINTSCQYKKKKMKRNFLVGFTALTLILFACKKDVSNSDKVYIRVENATSEGLNSFTLGATEFGAITSGDTSKYYLCKDVLPFPFANYIAINSQQIYIIDIVPTPFLSNGNYLMKVVSDTLPWRYKASFIKE